MASNANRGPCFRLTLLVVLSWLACSYWCASWRQSSEIGRIYLIVPPVQTLNQYLQTLGGAASKQTSLQSTMANNNIAGLYKQQQTDDRFKVGSPSGSVYWTAGQQLPLPYQDQSLLKQICACDFTHASAIIR